MGDEDHLWDDLAGDFVPFVDDLEVEKEEPLDDVFLGLEDVADDGDEEVGDRVAIEEEHDGALQGVDLGADVAPLEVSLDPLGCGEATLVQGHQKGARRSVAHGRRWLGQI